MPLGGDGLTDVALGADLQPGRTSEITFAAKAPGRSALDLRGRVRGDGFSGTVDLASADPARLEAWLGLTRFEALRRIRAQSATRNLAVSGRFTSSNSRCQGKFITY